MEQLNSLRNGLRLALDTNRTLILPYLRLGATLNDWVPFEDMARRYEAQDKTQHTSLCNTLDPALGCQYRLSSWTEIPWSTLFDLTFLQQHSVKVVERKNLDWRHGGGWLTGDDDNVVVMDPLTYWENGTHFDTHEKQTATQQTLWQWLYPIQQTMASTNAPLEHQRISSQYLQDHLQQPRLIQLGSLTLGTSISTQKSEAEARLLKDLSNRLVPNQLASLNHAADNIIKTLGGPQGYTSFHLHLSTLIQREISLLEQQQDLVAHDLDSATFLAMMDAVVLELLGEIPIGQAFSAALPIQPSRLLDHLHSNASLIKNDDSLLDVCMDYRNNVDPNYPIIYLVTDTLDTLDRTNMAPLLDFFPCLITRHDVQTWSPLPFGWSSVIPGYGMDDALVNYDVLLRPFLDILVADECKNRFDEGNLAGFELTRSHTFQLILS